MRRLQAVRLNIVGPDNMGKLIDMIDQKYNRLYIISRAEGSDSRAYWNCVCDCGNTIVVSGKKIRTGHTKSCGCYRKEVTAPAQGKNNIHNIKHIINKLKENGVELLSEYKGIKKRATFKCLTCDHEFSRRVETSLYGINGCPSCSKSMNGFIGTEYFNKNPKMKDVSCKLYLIEFTGNNEHFYKIGITRNSVEKRIRKIPYKGKILKVIESDMLNIFETEKRTKRINKSNRYLPKLKFNGHSECFRVIPEMIT